MSSVCTWETLYAGYRYDTMTGHFTVRFRVYHPDLGTWLTRDPLGYIGVLFYNYAENSPEEFTDPYGLRIDFHHWFPQAGRLRAKLWIVCGKALKALGYKSSQDFVDDFTTPYEGWGIGADHYFIQYKAIGNYNTKAEDIYDSAKKSCCDLIRRMSALIADAATQLYFNKSAGKFGPVQFPEMARYTKAISTPGELLGSILGFVCNPCHKTKNRVRQYRPVPTVEPVLIREVPRERTGPLVREPWDPLQGPLVQFPRPSPEAVTTGAIIASATALGVGALRFGGAFANAGLRLVFLPIFSPDPSDGA